MRAWIGTTPTAGSCPAQLQHFWTCWSGHQQSESRHSLGSSPGQGLPGRFHKTEDSEVLRVPKVGLALVWLSFMMHAPGTSTIFPPVRSHIQFWGISTITSWRSFNDACTLRAHRQTYLCIPRMSVMLHATGIPTDNMFPGSPPVSSLPSERSHALLE